MLKSNLIRSIEFGTVVARRLERALIKGYSRRRVSDENGEMQKTSLYSTRDHALRGKFL